MTVVGVTGVGSKINFVDYLWSSVHKQCHHWLLHLTYDILDSIHRMRSVAGRVDAPFEGMSGKGISVTMWLRGDERTRDNRTYG